MSDKLDFEKELIKLCGLEGRLITELTVRIRAGSIMPTIEVEELAPDTFEPVSRSFVFAEIVQDDVPRLP